jgi:taurine dioxygenase
MLPAMELTAASPALGTVVADVDLRVPLAPSDRTRLRTALERSYLLHFPGQELSDAQHEAVVAQFGAVANESGGAVGFVSNYRPDGSLGSGAATFHIDFGFTDQPYEYLSLYGLEIPAGGTVTCFANAVAAAADLPADLGARVESLSARAAVDVASPVREAGVRIDLGRLDESYPHAVRPVLWPHRLTGEPILAVWEQQTDALLPLPPDESAALLRELFTHLYRPDHVLVHHWQPGDLLVWDNHALQHARPDVGVDERRTLRRVCVGVAPDLSIFADRLAERRARSTTP